MSDYYHINWKFSDNTLLHCDLLNIIMSYGDPCIHQKFSFVLKQLTYLSKEYHYLINIPKRYRLRSEKQFYTFCLKRSREKRRLNQIRCSNQGETDDKKTPYSSSKIRNENSLA